MSESENRYRLVQDDSSHWYCVPADQLEQFNDLLERSINEDYDAEGEFNRLFTHCRLNMHITNYTFTDLKKD